MRRPLDPRICNIAIDANALDSPADLPKRASLVKRLIGLVEAGELTVTIPHSVLAEINAPATPTAVKRLAVGQLFTIPVQLTDSEARTRKIIEDALQGNAKPGRHKADASHLAEAAKYGGYFITHDERILKRSHGLEVLPPSLTVVTLEEFFRIYDAVATERP